MALTDPYLSVVATSRNDNHGGSLTRRMQIFASAFIAQCKRFNLPAELILVEWNPPPERAPLAQELRWPADPSPCQVRVITVPAEIHRRFKHSEHLPLFQMIAKNVGLRRARAPFVLCTNIDILFNDELMKFLAARRLEPGKLYRIDRWDVDSNVPLDAEVEKQLSFCTGHLIRVSEREGTHPATPEGVRKVYPNDVFDPATGIGFGRGWFPIRFRSRERPYRYISNDAELLIPGMERPAKGIKLDIEPSSGVDFRPFGLEILDEQGRIVASGWVFGRHWLHIQLPLEPGKPRRFRLRVEDGDKYISDEGSIHCARIHWCSWSTLEHFTGASADPEFQFRGMLPEFVMLQSQRGRGLLALDPPEPRFDIVRWSDRIILENNWHYFEIKDGDFTRWVDNDAVFTVKDPDRDCATLEIDIETGPGLCYEGFELQVLGGDGGVLSSFEIKGNPKRKARYLKNRVQAHRFALAPHAMDRSEYKPGVIKRIFRKLKRSDIHTLHLQLPLRKHARNLFVLHGAGFMPNPPGFPRNRNFRIHRLAWRHESPFAASTQTMEKDAFKVLTLHLECMRRREPKQDVLALLNKIKDASNRADFCPPVPVHMNSCGDFTLMAREHWFAVQGYPEIEAYSMHIDSLGCHAAVNLPLQEVTLPEPLRIYHIEHGQGSGWTPEGESKLFARMAEKGIPVLEFTKLLEWAGDMRRKGPLLFPKEHWGLADVDLKETVIGP